VSGEDTTVADPLLPLSFEESYRSTFESTGAVRLYRAASGGMMGWALVHGVGQNDLINEATATKRARVAMPLAQLAFFNAFLAFSLRSSSASEATPRS
jgi:hypothetical protein